MKEYNINRTCSIIMESNEEFIRLRSGVEHFILPIAQRFGLTPIQVAVLNLIRKTERPTVSKLFRNLDFNQGNMSSLCKRLESDGLITKTRCTDDERKSYLSLTEKGEAVLSDIDRLLDFSEKECWLTSEEIAAAEEALLTLSSIAGKINGILESYNEETKEEKDA